MKSLGLLLGIAFISIVGCKKYEDGPLLSARSVESRLYKVWRVDGTTAPDSILYQSPFDIHVGTTWMILDNQIVVSGYLPGIAESTLSDDKKKLSFRYASYPTPYETIEYEILRLTNRELKLRCNTSVSFTILLSRQ